MADSTTCKSCGRAVLGEHVNAAGNCVLCEPIPMSGKPTEAEWADLGRPKDKK